MPNHLLLSFLVHLYEILDPLPTIQNLLAVLPKLLLNIDYIF